MEIRNGLAGLGSLLNVNAPDAAADRGRNREILAANALNADHATLSSMASEIAQTAGDPEVRMEKISEVKAALAAGTYSVPASAVASKVIDSMLGGK